MDAPDVTSSPPPPPPPALRVRRFTLEVSMVEAVADSVADEPDLENLQGIVEEAVRWDGPPGWTVQVLGAVAEWS